jgi:hypothetical protein
VLLSGGDPASEEGLCDLQLCILETLAAKKIIDEIYLCGGGGCQYLYSLYRAGHSKKNTWYFSNRTSRTRKWHRWIALRIRKCLPQEVTAVVDLSGLQRKPKFVLSALMTQYL